MFRILMKLLDEFHNADITMETVHTIIYLQPAVQNTPTRLTFGVC